METQLILPHRNPNESISALACHAIIHEGCRLTNNGALCALTGKITGRSPKARRLVAHPSVRDEINWNNLNIPAEPDLFEILWREAHKHGSRLEHSFFYSNDLFIGTHRDMRIPIQTYTKYAWHQHFIRTMTPKCPGRIPGDDEWTLWNIPSFRFDPKKYSMDDESGLWIDFASKRILLAGLKYAGENKKAEFVVANFEFPVKDGFTMHCSVVVTSDGKVIWIFGLSGTGKTTLGMSDLYWPVGDDMFLYSLDDMLTCQLEDGCYPSILNLSEEREPIIHRAVNQFGTLLENVDLVNGNPVFESSKYTQNTRAAFPLSHIGDKRIPGGIVGKPDYIIFLECDAFGVRPPVSILRSWEQIAYYFMTGYTSKVGRTVGSSRAFEPVTSMAYGEDFFPRHPAVYLDLFKQVIEQAKPTVALVNTGWTGGSADDEVSGRRFSIPTSRIVMDAVIKNIVNAKTESEYIPEWNLYIPKHIPNVEDRNRDPRIPWKDRQDQYKALCGELRNVLANNWDKKFSGLPTAIRDAGPPRP